MRIPATTVLTRQRLLAVFSAIVLSLMFIFGSVQAQNKGAVQELTGPTGTGQGVFYLLPDLKKGDILYIYAGGESGNLDPFIALADSSLNRETLGDDFYAAVGRAIATGRDPWKLFPNLPANSF